MFIKKSQPTLHIDGSAVDDASWKLWFGVGGARNMEYPQTIPNTYLQK